MCPPQRSTSTRNDLVAAAIDRCLRQFTGEGPFAAFICATMLRSHFDCGQYIASSKSTAENIVRASNRISFFFEISLLGDCRSCRSNFRAVMRSALSKSLPS